MLGTHSSSQLLVVILMDPPNLVGPVFKIGVPFEFQPVKHLREFVQKNFLESVL
jgi:hypothetical protein